MTFFGSLVQARISTVAPGWRATLNEAPKFKGWAAVGEENIANYQLVRGPCSRNTFNDCESSIRVFRVR